MSSEAIVRFDCFGGRCAVLAASGPAGGAPASVHRARRRMLEWHERFSRFEPGSELCELNRDPRATVPVSPMMARLVATSLRGARATGGLVDPTLLGEMHAAGYRTSRAALGGPATVDLDRALAAAPDRRPASPRPDARWRDVAVDQRAATVTRPPGLSLDLGGIAKGVFGDVLAGELAHHDSFAVDVAGDVRFGGANTLPREIAVGAPAAPEHEIHAFRLHHGAVATSGIGRRAWSDPDGRPAHHLLDPATGRPAFTGVIQVTALAATGAGAEILAKAALLCGPERAAEWLPDGGVIVTDDGTATVVAPAATIEAAAA